MPELIVHIGAGKTGSTSVQFSLREAGQQLQRQKTAYVGLMLERVPGARQHDWCVDGAPQRFFQAEDPVRTDEEVYGVIRAELDRLGRQGIERAVWSNEAFLVQNARIIPILGRLADDGVPIRVICYVRRHDKRARSAYVEFGLKSKRYPGPLRSFRDWAGTHALRYADNLALWQAAFPGAVELYNFDAVGDVGAHFCEVLGLEEVPSVRANETPSDALLTAWTVYNGSKPRPTWANDFRRVAVPLKIHADRSPVPPLADLLPTPADLEQIQSDCREDLDRVNAILSAQGQPQMAFDAPQARPTEVAPWDMDQMLLKMVFSLQEQVLRLQRKVDALEEERATGSDGAGGAAAE